MRRRSTARVRPPRLGRIPLVLASITSIHRLKLLAALRRVSRQLSLWHELDAMELMLPSLRPTVEVPLLDREELKSLQVELVAALGEVEEQPFGLG